jgi:ABC-2 type transport system ATP-binding protein
MTALHVEDLVKKFGQITAVDNIHLDVESGQIFGFLGPNGRESPPPSKSSQPY